MSEARGFIGAGDLYISRYNYETGQFDGLKGPFEVSKFEIKPNVDRKEMISEGRNTKGQVIETVMIQKPFDFKLDMAEFNKESLSMALMGTHAPINQPAGTMVDVAVVVTAKDVWLPIGKQNLVDGLTVENADGTVAYVKGTDYEVNYRMGWIKVLTASAIAVNATINVSGTYNAVSGTEISGGTNSQIRARFVFEGINYADQRPVNVEVYEAVIASDSAFDFLTGDFAKTSLPGRLKTPQGKTAPFVVQMLTSG